MKQIESDDLFEEEDINECENINMNEKIDFIVSVMDLLKNI